MTPTELAGRLLYKDCQVTHQPHPYNPPITTASTSSTSSNHHYPSPSSAIPLQESPSIPPTIDNSMLTNDPLTSTDDSCTSEQFHSVLPPPLVCTSNNTVDSNSADSQGCSYKLTIRSGDSSVPTESSNQSAHIILTPNSDEDNLNGFKTTLAASITEIIECDDALRKFDELRSILKEAKKEVQKQAKQSDGSLQHADSKDKPTNTRAQNRALIKLSKISSSST